VRRWRVRSSRQRPLAPSAAPRPVPPFPQRRPWQCLNFLPEPHGQGAFRGTVRCHVSGSSGLKAGP